MMSRSGGALGAAQVARVEDPVRGPCPGDRRLPSSSSGMDDGIVAQGVELGHGVAPAAVRVDEAGHLGLVPGLVRRRARARAGGHLEPLEEDLPLPAHGRGVEPSTAGRGRPRGASSPWRRGSIRTGRAASGGTRRGLLLWDGGLSKLPPRAALRGAALARAPVRNGSTSNLFFFLAVWVDASAAVVVGPPPPDHAPSAITPRRQGHGHVPQDRADGIEGGHPEWIPRPEAHGRIQDEFRRRGDGRRQEEARGHPRRGQEDRGGKEVNQPPRESPDRGPQGVEADETRRGSSRSPPGRRAGPGTSGRPPRRGPGPLGTSPRRPSSPGPWRCPPRPRP